ncbi:hypothetical protein [Thalassovita taeanensis]|uniref:hypothetical protein n=1 Tax=Thalassovita taeanensis TaxID=657014 RepID=UPI0015877684|nr:hypothetical protein [Thalassovita taeanensis]
MTIKNFNFRFLKKMKLPLSEQKLRLVFEVQRPAKGWRVSGLYRNTGDYLFKVKRYVRPDGERFATVVDRFGVPSYYPTALMLSRRPKGISVKTMEATAADLVHVGLWTQRERIDLNARLEALADIEYAGGRQHLCRADLAGDEIRTRLYARLGDRL